MLPDQLTAKFLGWIGRRFYAKESPLFFQEQKLLIMAVTVPADYLEMRGVRISAERYEQILILIIKTIAKHGDLKKVRSFGRYFLHAVQEHLKHHGDSYYEEAKHTRNAIEDVMHGLSSRAIQSVDNTVPVLAQTHRVLSAAKPGRKPKCSTPASDLQTDFLALATPPRDSVRQQKHSQTVVTSPIPGKKFSNRPRAIQSRANA